MSFPSTARFGADRFAVRLFHIVAFSAWSAAAMAQGSNITGRVTAGSGQPVADASVIAVGTSSSAITAQDGKYILRHVAPGKIEVQVLRVGFQSQKKTVTLDAANGSADFTLVPMIVRLDEVVTIAAEQRRTVERGYNTALIADVGDRMERSPTTITIGDLLSQKAPSVSVLGQGMIGTAASVRIRGFNSIGQSNEPIYVVDGVRVAVANTTPGSGVGGSQASLLNSLTPEEIESVEVLKGPGAATMYGTNAANGVIRITTKKGRVGNAKWTWMTEQGNVADKNEYPATYAIWGHAPAPAAATPIRCLLATMGPATCLKDSTTSLNLLSNSTLTPLASAPRNLYGLQVTGGTDAVRFYVAGNVENTLGPRRMPKFSADRLDSLKVNLRGEWAHPEAFQRENFRINVNATLTPTLDLGVNGALIKSDQRMPQSDNSPVGIYAAARESPGFDHPGLGYTNIGALGETLHGYNGWVPSEMFQDLSTENVQRQLLSGTASWRPKTWLSNEAAAGVDYATVTDFNVCRLNECPAYSTPTVPPVALRNGQSYSKTTGWRTLSAKWTSSGTWDYRPDINLRTTGGFDYVYAENDNSAGFGFGLPPGTQNVGQAAARTSATNLQATVGKTAGLFLQEQAALRDRLFLTLGLRSDQNSAFGGGPKRWANYPSATASWLLSEEDFFPKFDWLNQFRARLAYGVSGLQPGLSSARKTYSPITASYNGTDILGVLGSNIGDPDLKPERVSEVEGGFDTRILKNRVNIELTYFRKSTTDAILTRSLAPSSASPSLFITENIGSLKNSGVEAVITTQLVDRKAIGWDVTIGASHGSSEITNLGPSGTIKLGNTWQAVGQPVYGLFFRPYTFSDANGDGLLQPSEVVVDTTTKAYGYQVPRDLVSIQNGLDVLSHRLRLTALLDYKGGYSVYDASSAFLCTNYLSCPDESNPSASLADQARSVAARYGTTVGGTVYTTNAGYLSNGAFWRLREVSAALTMPDQFNKWIRSQGTTLNIGARNLHVWTSYRGVDPESNYGAGDLQTDFLTAGPSTYYSVRLTLHY